MYFLAEIFSTGECRIFNSPKKAVNWIIKECLLGSFYRIVNVNSSHKEIYDTREGPSLIGQVQEIEI